MTARSSVERLTTPDGIFEVKRFGLSDEPRPLAIVLHGFPDHPPSFDALSAKLAAAGYEVAAPWMRGYSPSTLEGPFHVDRLAADVLALATALGRERFFLVGHDWGAAVTYQVCGEAPERVIAAVTMAVPHPLAFLRSWVTTAQLARSTYMLLFQLPLAEALVRASDFALVDWLWRRWSPGFRLEAEPRRALRDCLAESLPAPLDYYRAMMQPPGEAFRRLSASGKRGPITTPLRHLQGADDGCIAPSACAGQEKYFGGPFESEVLPSVGHFMHLEAPGAVAGRAIDWLGRFPA